MPRRPAELAPGLGVRGAGASLAGMTPGAPANSHASQTGKRRGGSARSRNVRREEPLGVHLPDPIIDPVDGTCPERVAPDGDLRAHRGSSAHSSPPRARATARGCRPSSIPTSSFAPTSAQRTRRPRCEARVEWRSEPWASRGWGSSCGPCRSTAPSASSRSSTERRPRSGTVDPPRQDRRDGHPRRPRAAPRPRPHDRRGTSRAAVHGRSHRADEFPARDASIRP